MMPSGIGGISTPIKTDLFHVVRVDHAKIDVEAPHFDPALPICEKSNQYSPGLDSLVRSSRCG